MVQEMFLAGSETTSSTIEWAMTELLHRPDSMRKVKEELDRVIGRSRMPEFPDRESLHYINALISEVLRWYPIVPLGVSRKFSPDSEEIYNGMRFPRGSIIIPNVWCEAMA